MKQVTTRSAQLLLVLAAICIAGLMGLSLAVIFDATSTTQQIQGTSPTLPVDVQNRPAGIAGPSSETVGEPTATPTSAATAESDLAPVQPSPTATIEAFQTPPPTSVPEPSSTATTEPAPIPTATSTPATVPTATPSPEVTPDPPQEPAPAEPPARELAPEPAAPAVVVRVDSIGRSVTISGMATDVDGDLERIVVRTTAVNGQLHRREIFVGGASEHTFDVQLEIPASISGRTGITVFVAASDAERLTTTSAIEHEITPLTQINVSTVVVILDETSNCFSNDPAVRLTGTAGLNGTGFDLVAQIDGEVRADMTVLAIIDPQESVVASDGWFVVVTAQPDAIFASDKTSFGKIQTVHDAPGKFVHRFEDTSGCIGSVNYQILIEEF